MSLSTRMLRLSRSFFSQPTLIVAQELLGKIIVFGGHKLQITETEAYLGEGDPACHASRGLTKRTAIMFGSPGFSYVYLIYGMYYCLNFVTEPEGKPAAVLIRGAIDIDSKAFIDGPGKLCRFLGITKDKHNAIDIVKNETFYLVDVGIKPHFIQTPRVGIKLAVDKPWRFLIKD